MLCKTSWLFDKILILCKILRYGVKWVANCSMMIIYNDDDTSHANRMMEINPHATSYGEQINHIDWRATKEFSFHFQDLIYNIHALYCVSVKLWAISPHTISYIYQFRCVYLLMMRIRYDYILPELECAEVQLQIESPHPPTHFESIEKCYCYRDAVWRSTWDVSYSINGIFYWTVEGVKWKNKLHKRFTNTCAKINLSIDINRQETLD